MATGGFEITEDMREVFKEELHAALEVAFEKIGLAGERFAKKACPVDTGRLRSSISHAYDVGAGEVYVGTNVEYAAYVEFGTRRQRAQPYLRAALAHGDVYRKLLESTLRNWGGSGG
jgi:HK97 gp10 family phage protein